MPKSKRTAYSYFLLLIFICWLSLFLFSVFLIINRQTLKNGLWFLPSFTAFWTLFFGQYIRKGFKSYGFKNNEKTITIKNPFFFINKQLNLSSFDGYITGRAKRGNFSLYKVIFLVEKGKMTQRIDEMFIKNINEIELPIKSQLKYLGYQNITFKKRIKMIFQNISIE